MAIEDYKKLARLYDYPEDDYGAGVAAVVPQLAAQYPTAAKELSYFAEHVSRLSLDEAQELYTRTLDVQAITTLDLGYVLYGDDYKRGELLANLNREHTDAGNDCGTELADHLPNLLRLMAMLGETEFVVELVEYIIAPALRAMVREFDSKRLERKTKFYQKSYKTLIDSSEDEATLYVHSLIGLYSVLQADFALVPNVDTEDPGRSSDFLRFIGTEMEIEKSKNPTYALRGMS
jgi:nitrate reductase assembly molybdenum cofactor insertion protein NarJ